MELLNLEPESVGEEKVDSGNSKPESADEEKIYILHPNGETFLLNPSRNIFSNQPKHQEILPGSIIFVPKKVENRLAARLAAQSYAAILGSIGVSLASLSVLKD